jgi:GntR family transcriptional repressor for pyruvate dehydrogenase complex
VNEDKSQKRRLVQDTAEKLREVILAHEVGAQIGSLTAVAEQLSVGIVTVQQAARILEHEGLLEVRRGPGGGYYGARPDKAALDRAFATYMRVHGYRFHDSMEMLSLLDCEIMPAAARCEDETLRAPLIELTQRIDTCDRPEDRMVFEGDMRNALFNIVKLPLIELLARVTMQMYNSQSEYTVFAGEEGVQAWKAGRRRILDAILQQDEQLAQFEAGRYRKEILSRLEVVKAKLRDQA